ncbi:MAG: hypothetical protein JW810_03170 [Sedimentisphaerales bacterium]|nr:hypothetical protein [Sedimentisphaerales bacterium]
MRIPKENAERYAGLYVIDYGSQCGIGYTAREVAEVLESQRFEQVKIYKIHRARPDGTLELRGVARERFELESGMFFTARGEEDGQAGFQTLLQWARRQAPPCRSKLQLARTAEGTLILALIYPAEYDEPMGAWLAESGYRGKGPVDAGISQVERFYQQTAEFVAREQLWPDAATEADAAAEPLRDRVVFQYKPSA